MPAAGAVVLLYTLRLPRHAAADMRRTTDGSRRIGAACSICAAMARRHTGGSVRLQLNESAAAYESVPVKKLLLLLSKLCGETLVRDSDPSSRTRRLVAGACCDAVSPPLLICAWHAATRDWPLPCEPYAIGAWRRSSVPLLRESVPLLRE